MLLVVVNMSLIDVQLKDECNAGGCVSLGGDGCEQGQGQCGTTTIHDVAALLKEYFRDLPDPLLTRHLYSAFLATRSEFSSPFHLLALVLVSAVGYTYYYFLGRLPSA